MSDRARFILEDHSDWTELGERLRAVNPTRYVELRGLMSVLVENAETSARILAMQAEPMVAQPIPTEIERDRWRA